MALRRNQELKFGDCLTVLKTFPDNSLDSLVTDPPAGISFMNKAWDKDKGGRDQWIAWMTEVMKECHRVLKPGAHGLVWAIPRTSHWTATALENAGFEVRDVLTHLFGSGFPKSLSVDKALNKAGNTEAAKQWEGWGTSLKPASEHWVLVRKPLAEKTVAANVLKHGTGGLNIDGCRIVRDSDDVSGWSKSGSGETDNTSMSGKNYAREPKPDNASGRFPANLVLSGGADVDLDNQAGDNVSRYFYVAKASKSDKGKGNKHPTVKSTKLMEYLIKLITPPNSMVLDPFMGSGSTGVAAKRSSFGFVGIEAETEYFQIASERLEDYGA